MEMLDFLQLFADGGPAAGAQGGAVTPDAAPPEAAPDLTGEFDQLIQGKYKEQYHAKVQDTIHRRLRSSRETVEKFNTLTPALKVLSDHYGLDGTDMAALCKAVEGDDTFYQKEAAQRGLPVDQLRAFRALEQENAALRQQESRARWDHQMGLWDQQAKQAREVYPDLDMNTECADPQFRRLLLQGLDVQTAYLVVHRQELMKQAADAGKQMLASHLAGAAARPSENGTTSQSASVSRFDVAAMTKKDREAIRRRAARGERIRL